MKCVVLGGGGFIGSSVSDALIAAGYSVKIFEHPRVMPYRTFTATESVQWMTGDFVSSADVDKAIEGTDTVVHLVSTTLPKNSNDDPIYDVETNLISTLNMLNSMVKHGVKKIIFISSGGTVYGNPMYLPIDEKHPTEPLVSYGLTKLTIEKYLSIFKKKYDIQCISLRVANPYGERQRIETAQGVVSVFLHNAIKDIPLNIWGDGSITRDYIYVSDVAYAFVCAARYEGKVQVFNIGSGVGTSLNELTGMLEAQLGRSVKRTYLPGRIYDVNTSILSNSLALQELQWAPRVSIRDGIQRTAQWIKQELR